MEVLGGSHSYTHRCVNDENTHRDKWWSTEHAVTITASCCLAAWRNQKPHIKLSQPELHAYHLLIGNTDKNHPFPILSRVQPSDSLMGMKSKQHLCQLKELLVRFLLKCCMIWSQKIICERSPPLKISSNAEVGTDFSTDELGLHRRTQDCLGITALNACFSRFWWASQLDPHCYEGLFSHTMWIWLLSKAQGHQACVYLDSKSSNN